MNQLDTAELFEEDRAFLKYILSQYLINMALLTLIGMSYEKQGKYPSLAPPRGNFYKTQ